MPAGTDGGQTGGSWERDMEQFFREHHGFVYRTAHGILGRPEDAEDVVQNLFLKFLQHEPSPGVRKDPSAYLYRAAVNESLNVLRSRKRRHESDGVEGLEIAEPRTDRANDNVRTKLRELLSELEPDIARILTLHYEQGYSDTEIAQMLGCKRGKIAMILSRSRAQLHEFLESGFSGKAQKARKPRKVDEPHEH